MTSQGDYIEINGTSLYYELSGNSDGEPLVIILKQFLSQPQD
ncbi:hypothetical protein SAMN02745781_00568 [Vibrio gazogenes DSM 21264]|uniref:Uncharacterized protein n=1 Tax=Vibrio gazogenes DSM 21264 = NBRC 103151 TaxID=1123492 RepID=A0A1M4UUT6_VIBGA|nr:hypothetical protein SAMN02745781_00568 [Vibrio gazogenes DSM 21264] [Vibrio gazogenes DSM 21264 = NBRC 103151]SJN56135.1 hypothetical protein BQ6471_01896 [Vibrio gazogenes]